MLLCSFLFITIKSSQIIASAYEYHSPKITINIQEACYGDFDKDLLKDDIRITLSLQTEFEGYFHHGLELEIILPSGKSFDFEVQFQYYAEGNHYIILTAFNTAIEKGWYSAYIEGYIFLENGYFFNYERQTTFDPPTENEGPAEPSLTVSVTS